MKTCGCVDTVSTSCRALPVLAAQASSCELANIRLYHLFIYVVDICHSSILTYQNTLQHICLLISHDLLYELLICFQPTPLDVPDVYSGPCQINSLWPPPRVLVLLSVSYRTSALLNPFALLGIRQHAGRVLPVSLQQLQMDEETTSLTSHL